MLVAPKQQKNTKYKIQNIARCCCCRGGGGAHTWRIILATLASVSCRGVLTNRIKSPSHRSIAMYVSAPTSLAPSSSTTNWCRQVCSACSSNAMAARSDSDARSCAHNHSARGTVRSRKQRRRRAAGAAADLGDDLQRHASAGLALGALAHTAACACACAPLDVSLSRKIVPHTHTHRIPHQSRRQCRTSHRSQAAETTRCSCAAAPAVQRGAARSASQTAACLLVPGSLRCPRSGRACADRRDSPLRTRPSPSRAAQQRPAPHLAPTLPPCARTKGHVFKFAGCPPASGAP
jgi:hypothetical protein